MGRIDRQPSSRRAQWGSERTRTPLDTVHRTPSEMKIIWGRVAIIVTIAAWVGYLVFTVVPRILSGEGVLATLEAILYGLVVTFLSFSALMYLVARSGAFGRFRDHARIPRGELDRHFAHRAGSGMTVLVPSYAEETAVIRKTMWSAALQEYPDLRVVLLLDDPPTPTDPAVRARLEETRGIAAEIATALEMPRARFAENLFALEHRWILGPDPVVDAEALEHLVADYDLASQWLRDMAGTWPHEDHVDTFFIDQVLRELASDLDLTAQALSLAAADGDTPTVAHVRDMRRRLVQIFTAELTTFERKQYASLSHEPNKAMNLNSYIGLMGGRYREEHGPGGTLLRPVAGSTSADLIVPNADYLLTLDADSLLLRDYCIRLVYFLEQPGNERVAVTQTPYSSFRGAPTRIERLAGASTDIQHILHQGMTAHGATFWVGANAVIRMEALDDILEIDTVDGFEVRRYVQDRTVIEDTESSIDIADRGWTLANYPERLSYSATPPDFGSLVVQRRRWANGGLLILPKFWRFARSRHRSGRSVSLAEWMLRTNYMASLAWASFGLILMLTLPFDSRLLSPLVVFAALPYFLAQASDLKYCGYRRIDIFRIYGFNLILLPVNLAGVLKSIEQALTGRKIPFARTPKVKDRTATQLLYVAAPWAIIAFSVYTTWWNAQSENWGTAAFAAFNAVTALWATLENIGLRASVADTWLGLTDWMWVDARPKASAAASEAAEVDWREVLYRGYPASGESHRGVASVRDALPAAPPPADAEPATSDEQTPEVVR